jgi:histidinol dehydrogenase
MRCERFTLSGDPDETARALRGLIPAPESVGEMVAEIIAEVRAHGDMALLAYVRRFDTGGAQPKPLRAQSDELEAAAATLEPPVRHGLERAIENLETAMVGWRAGLGRSVQMGENRVVLRHAAVSRAAVYVPGGRAPYPSTVVMGVVPARLAGVEYIAVCAPPNRDGDVDPVVLAACHMTGATAVYRMGGAHAIAALAYGTASVAPVDVIVGPGNLYVQEAKRQVFGQVGIDGFAGPSDLLAIATADADLELLSLDLLAQAEHGAGSLVIAVSDARELLAELARRLEAAPDTGAVSGLVQVTDPDQALAVAEAFAPSISSSWAPAPRSWRITSRGPVACSSARSPAPRSATTSRARTTSCRPTGRPASLPDWAPSTSCAGSPRCESATRTSSRGPPSHSRVRRASCGTPGRWRRAFGKMTRDDAHRTDRP